jgi:molybdopterin-guanine dinucleotide biosynthesis protein A
VSTPLDGAIVLAGGSGRRLGGVDKASLLVGSRTLLQTTLAAVSGCPVVVVGPARAGTDGATFVQEQPPGGGPAAGVAAGLAALRPRLPGSDAPMRSRASDPAALVAVLAVDQPGVTAATLARLARAVPADRRAGAVLLWRGRRQYPAGVFPAPALAAALRARPSWHGVALRALMDPLVGVEVPAEGDEARDVDTPEDLAHWQRHGATGVR